MPMRPTRSARSMSMGPMTGRWFQTNRPTPTARPPMAGYRPAMSSSSCSTRAPKAAETSTSIASASRTGSTPLTTTPGDDGTPAVSPDGSKIAFQSDRNGGCLFVMDADGSNVARLTTGCTKGFPKAWAPDGTLIGWAVHDGRTSTSLVTSRSSDRMAAAGPGSPTATTSSTSRGDRRPRRETSTPMKTGGLIVQSPENLPRDQPDPGRPAPRDRALSRCSWSPANPSTPPIAVRPTAGWPSERRSTATSTSTRCCQTGRRSQRLTTDPLFDACPAWSADGSASPGATASHGRRHRDLDDEAGRDRQAPGDQPRRSDDVPGLLAGRIADRVRVRLPGATNDDLSR